MSLSTPTDFVCAVQNFLQEGDACIPNTTAIACDPNNLVCDPGTLVCVNPDAAACADVIDFDTDPIQVNVSANDFTDGRCTEGNGDAEVVLRYEVVAEAAVVTFQAFNAGGLYVRTECAVPSSELSCTDSGTNKEVTLVGVTGGTELFVFAEGTADQELIINVIEQDLVLLNEGDPCDPTSLAEVCDPGSLLVCVGEADAEACAPDEAGPLNAHDILLNAVSG